MNRSTGIISMFQGRGIETESVWEISFYIV